MAKQKKTVHRSQARNMVEELLHLASFTIGLEEFGLGFLKVNDLQQLTEAGGGQAATWLDGSGLGLGSEAIPIIHLCQRDNGKPGYGKDKWIVIVKLGSRVMGCIIDPVVQERSGAGNRVQERSPILSVAANPISTLGKLRNRSVLYFNCDGLLANAATKPVGAA